MATTHFTDQETTVVSDWLNDVDDLTYNLFDTHVAAYNAHITDYNTHVVTYDAHVADTANPHNVTPTQLSLVIGTDVQAYDATLQSFSSLGTAADKLGYTTGVDTWAETTLSAYARTLLDDTTAAAARTTLDVYSTTEVDTNTVAKTSSTGSAKVPAGTTAQRDGTPAGGYVRYNSTTGKYEGYFPDLTLWAELGGGQLYGNAAVKGIFYNNQTIAEDITIEATNNAMSAGPITIDTGFTVTVETGARWVIN